LLRFTRSAHQAAARNRLPPAASQLGTDFSADFSTEFGCLRSALEKAAGWAR
jgi:hypothetical protein